MTMKVKEVAELAGVSVRTLHHYDEIGLLMPDAVTEAGYRLYSKENLERLQQILFFRELDFPLKEIRTMLDNPAFDREEALELQRKMLLKKRRQLDDVIDTIDRTIQGLKGEIQLTQHDQFKGFHFDKDPYEQEARERWGDQAVDVSKEKLSRLSEKEQGDLSVQWEDLYRRLAELRGYAANSEEVQVAIGEWYDFLNANFGTYSPEAFAGLGQLYMADERFTKNIDQYGEGLAQLMSEAMIVFAERKN
ncbi:Mercuric resistance operon regulatory protein [Lentibacillus sp. JNUCC-1]|uniref:MerR family transcriptional regulator n=1 Tax=Lentibacillus sp. JNUCC-1 TaxID=2654513 RepID=UPI0012E8FE8B|nr:MerR family transcriptional regulator [Lentibacillus sp. JNUCC-1]MUV37746.1 Mercuric resistance operon regulatory protein [Lentibacillus sp. JNUCC-1]